jgi:hypothetical protein
MMPEQQAGIALVPHRQTAPVPAGWAGAATAPDRRARAALVSLGLAETAATSEQVTPPEAALVEPALAGAALAPEAPFGVGPAGEGLLETEEAPQRRTQTAPVPGRMAALVAD